MVPNRRFHSPNDFLGKSAEDRIAEEKASQKRIADLFPVADRVKKERACLLEKIFFI